MTGVQTCALPISAIRDVLDQLEAGGSLEAIERDTALVCLRELEIRARDLRRRGGLFATVRLSQQAQALGRLDTHAV